MTEYRNEFMMQPVAAQDALETHQLTLMSAASSDPLEELAGLVGRGGLKTAEEAAAEKALVERHANQTGNTTTLPKRPAPRPVAPIVPPSAETFDAIPEWTKVAEADAPPLTFDLNAEINRQLSSAATVPPMGSLSESVSGFAASEGVFSDGFEPTDPPATDVQERSAIDLQASVVEPAEVAQVEMVDEPALPPIPDPVVSSGVQNAIFDTRALEEALAQPAEPESEPKPEANPEPKPVPNIVPEPLAQPVFEPVSQPIEFVSAIDETLSSAVPESEPATITETISETWPESVPETVAQSLPIVEPQDDPSMAFNDALLDGLDEELDRALELEMEQSLREEAFADLSTTAPEPELEPEPQREPQPAAPNDAEALLEAFRAEEIAMGQTPAAASAAAPQASDVDELSAALSDALAMHPAPGEQSAEDFEQELARLMGEAKGARPQPAAAAPPPAEPAFAQSFEKSFETAPQPVSQPSLHPSFQPAPPPPPQPIPMDGEALQASGQPVPPTPAMVEPQLDYSDPVEEFAALDDRWQDQTAPVQDASQSAPAPIDPPALSMMERVLGSASALGFAAKGQPHNPSFDESFSQAFDEALSADLAADQATDAVQPAPTKAASMTPPVAPSAPAPMPRSPEPVAVSAPAAPRVAAAPSVSAFGPDNSVFSDPSLQNQVEPVAAAPQKKSGKKVAAVIAAIALIGGGAAFAYSYYADSSADAPTLMARTDAVKEKPKDAGGRVVPNQDQSVFKADDGAATTAPVQEQLQDGSEEPVAIARAKAEDRTTGIDGATPGRLVQPRRVRTVTVRPDGTIVSSTADDAPSAVVPNVSLNPLTDIGVAPSATPAPTAAPTPVPTQTVTPSAPSTGFTYNAPTAPSSTDAPAPDPLSVASAPSAAEPVKTPVQAVPTPKPTAPAPTPPTSVATVNEDGISTGPAPPFAVQVSSQRSAAAANQTYRTLSRRYASLLDGKGVDIRRIEISGRGVFYRVRIPAQTQVEANSLCSDLKAQGGDCFVTR